eukprot:CAMPEP_0197021784 /NCGR_PEP_ID=MMETSP1384-20130603/2704_1 /TAXON_ID=29189 /ORGANISM="Ammonia sp." /LENGTH=157 /DNA_ID=CAMNT_0042449691 /DNA_START=38 /DNA_END=512 /DNA_ORIENTATION=+
MSTKHKRARNSEGVNDTPAKKKQKLSQSDDDDLQSQIKAMEKLKKERSEAIAVLTAKQEKEMEALTEKYDAEIETLEQKLREKSLCPECYKEPNDECTDCGLVFCGDCVDEDEQHSVVTVQMENVTVCSAKHAWTNRQGMVQMLRIVVVDFGADMAV